MGIGPNPCVERGELRDASLVDKLMALEDCWKPNAKALEFACHLLCLEIPDSDDGSPLRLTHINTDNNQEYVAVSHSWKTVSGHEDDRHGSYRIIGSPYGHSNVNASADDTIRRSINYARARKVSHVWLDKDCVEQRASKTKQTAMDSMDLVYRYSKYPLGLLTFEMTEQWQIDTLYDLFHFSDSIHDKAISWPHRFVCTISEAKRFLSLLTKLAKDPWWNRAWIFQEEYVSGIKMHLSIPYRRGLNVPYDLLKGSGEVYINASKFRESVTWFLLMVERTIRPRVSNKILSRLPRFLHKFGKYNVLYQEQQVTQLTAMSSRIFQDIGLRESAQADNLLSIAANSCDYPWRLDVLEMKDQGHSIGLGALAMYLRNGEIIMNCDLIKKRPNRMNMGEYLRYISLRYSQLPVSDKELTYMKGCRLRHVSFSRAGIRTKGCIWKVVREISTKGWSSISPGIFKAARMSEKRWCCNNLSLLMEMLSRNRQKLPLFLLKSLQELLDQVVRADYDKTSAALHKDVMARAIVDAIHDEKTLYLVQQRGGHSYPSGIVVGLQRHNSRVFTSWVHREDEDGRKRETRVSLEVEVEGGAASRLKTVGWVNALVFYKFSDEREVMFKWPLSWTTRS